MKLRSYGFRRLASAIRNSSENMNPKLSVHGPDIRNLCEAFAASGFKTFEEFEESIRTPEFVREALSLGVKNCYKEETRNEFAMFAPPDISIPIKSTITDIESAIGDTFLRSWTCSYTTEDNTFVVMLDMLKRSGGSLVIRVTLDDVHSAQSLWLQTYLAKHDRTLTNILSA